MEGAYDFGMLNQIIDACASRGWGVGIRLLTARLDTTPGWLAPYGVAKLFTSQPGKESYDPADDKFHQRSVPHMQPFVAQHIDSPLHASFLSGNLGSHVCSSSYPRKMLEML